MAPMPTLICFSGLGGDGITVEETPEHVLQGLSDSSGHPLLLTRNGDHEEIYVNPSRIACWYPSSGDIGDPPMVPRPFRGPI
jgi:hypothetical protein